MRECGCSCDHEWEDFVADEGKGASGGTAYRFCRKCKHTLLPGRGVTGFSDCPKSSTGPIEKCKDEETR